MPALITTTLGEPLPPHPHHGITCHMPKWQSVVRFADRDPEFMKQLKTMYPRMMLHQDVKQLVQIFLNATGFDSTIYTCLPYTSATTAQQCKAFAISPMRGEGAALSHEIQIKVIDVDVRYYVVYYPILRTSVTQAFWSHSGLGTSSRQAEYSLQNISKLRVIEDPDVIPKPEIVLLEAHLLVRERIAGLLERAPAAGRLTSRKVSPDDIYLFQTGMASIYSVHTWLVDHFNHEAKSVLFGFAFHHTIYVFNFFGPGRKFLGKGDEDDMKELEGWLKEEKSAGSKVQALWVEYPSNPLINTPNLRKLRRLANEYDFLLIVDETIGSFCNVDVLGFADIVVTSLTKSFSGYADVLGASAVINPSMPRYQELKDLFQQRHEQQYFNGDVEQLELNSRTYLQRSTILNKNAIGLVECLQRLSLDPSSCIAHVFYTTTSEGREFFEETMRQTTSEFTPGYGCLFSVEFKHVEQAMAFFDNLNVHNGPHLGAHLTIALPYTRALYSKDLEWAATHNMRPPQIRIAVGLEDIEDLLETFGIAINAAQKVEISSMTS